jgi:hypothetical protein
MRFGCALPLVLALAVARAGDASEAAPDSISSAKKDLAAVKALGTPAESPVASLPSVDMKAVGPGPGGVRIDAPAPLPADDEATADPSKRKEKGATGNWLVDAMDKKTDKERSASGRDALSKVDRDLALRNGERAATREELESPGAPESAGRAGPKESNASVYNPLDAFMAGWVSARDRELLLPARGDGAAGGEFARARPGSPQDGGPALGDFTIEGLLSTGELGIAAEARAESNPYLSSADLAEAPSPRMFSGPEASGPVGPEGRAAPAWFGSEAGALDAPRTFVPDFAHPSDDDKYFKQMKKF